MNILFKNDKKLIKELRIGNKKAYTFLFKTYYNSLCIYCFSLTKNNDLAQSISLRDSTFFFTFPLNRQHN